MLYSSSQYPVVGVIIDININLHEWHTVYDTIYEIYLLRYTQTVVRILYL